MCPVVLVWERLQGFSMGIRGSGQHWEETGGYQDSGEDYYVPGKKHQDRGFRKEQEIFWSYLGMKLSRPQDLKGKH